MISDYVFYLKDASDFTEGVGNLQKKFRSALADIDKLRKFTNKKKGKKRGPPAHYISNKMYLMPEGSPTPNFSMGLQDNVLSAHQESGYGESNLSGQMRTLILEPYGNMHYLYISEYSSLVRGLQS